MSIRINDINELPELGLYLNDLNQHGLSKEMVLTGWQHNSKWITYPSWKNARTIVTFYRLELMFDKAEQRATELESNYALLDKWKRRGDDLLYSMIPKTVADRLRAGHSPLSTCEVIDQSLLLVWWRWISDGVCKDYRWQFDKKVRDSCLKILVQSVSVVTSADVSVKMILMSRLVGAILV